MMKMCLILITPLLLTSGVAWLGMILKLKKAQTREFHSPFECGFKPLFEARLPHSLYFFLTALIFMVFDMEIVILLPYLLTLGSWASPKILFTFILTLGVVSIGLINEWNQSKLEWSQ